MNPIFLLIQIQLVWLLVGSLVGLLVGKSYHTKQKDGYSLPTNDPTNNRNNWIWLSKKIGLKYQNSSKTIAIVRDCICISHQVHKQKLLQVQLCSVFGDEDQFKLELQKNQYLIRTFWTNQNTWSQCAPRQRRRRRRLYTVSILYYYKKDNYNWSPIDTLLHNITSQLNLPLYVTSQYIWSEQS